MMARDLAVIVGRQIRARRLAAGMRYQRELAEKMSAPTISNQTISDWERGLNVPSDKNLRELAEILGCEVADFYIEPVRGSTPDLSRNGGPDEDDRLATIEAKLDRIETVLERVLTRLPEKDEQTAAIHEAFEDLASRLGREIGKRPPRSRRARGQPPAAPPAAA